MTLKPDWRFDPDNIQVSYPSVAFFSMARGANAVWAVGQDGVYRFDGGAAPDFTAFPTTWRVPESGIDWSHPDFVLVFTDKAAHDVYQTAPAHVQFIEENKASWKQVRIFDSYVDG